MSDEVCRHCRMPASAHEPGFGGLGCASGGSFYEAMTVRTNKCGACRDGRHEDCSGWCFCDCEYNR